MKLTRTELENLIKEGVNKTGTDNRLGQSLFPDQEIKSDWNCFAEFAHAVAVAEKSHRRKMDKRLVDYDTKTALSEGSSEQGGYLVPVEYRRELLKVAIEKSNILNRCTKVPMATNAIRFPYLSGFDRSGGLIHGGVEFVWLDEAADKTQKKPKFGAIELRLKKCAALVKSSDEILEDSWISMEPLLKNAFTDGLAWQLDWVFLNGSGAGQPMGILSAACLVTIAKETGQVANTIVFENICKMYARLWRKSAGVWFANHDILPQLLTMSISVGTGGIPVYMPAGGASGKPYDTLMGLPVIWSEHCQTLGTKGDIYLCDWSQYLVGQKAGPGGGLKFDTSIHLYFLSDETAFRFVYRVDGQPWWPSALTPRYSADTLSPFICVDTRA